MAQSLGSQLMQDPESSDTRHPTPLTLPLSEALVRIKSGYNFRGSPSMIDLWHLISQVHGIHKPKFITDITMLTFQLYQLLQGGQKLYVQELRELSDQRTAVNGVIISIIHLG